MPVTQPSSSSKPAKTEAQPTTSRALKRMRQVIILVLLVIPIFVAWQVLNYVINNTDPTVAGRPLSNPKTHLHQVALGGKPGRHLLQFGWRGKLAFRQRSCRSVTISLSFHGPGWL